jgi:uncharacterized membrane protein
MGQETLAFLTAFLASSVEAVEALTIVLGVGVVRGWRSPLMGVATAAAVLVAVVAVLGPALDRIPIEALQLVVGALLLVFGLQWLRKAILRASGFKALHDEEIAYREERELASGAPSAHGRMDWYSFTVAFKGVLLEGLEVVFIVVALGSAQDALGLAALGAAVAVLLVAAVGAVVHRPLARVPENAVKLAVGLLLTSFGCFWAAEGVGVEWPGGEASLPAVIAYFAVVSYVLARALRGRRSATHFTGAAA